MKRRNAVIACHVAGTEVRGDGAAQLGDHNLAFDAQGNTPLLTNPSADPVDRELFPVVVDTRDP
ncbi:MAG: hypothetical protein ABIQ16_15580 [Polyangiaceae bacterium]